jgi:hypothetical protein
LVGFRLNNARSGLQTLQKRRGNTKENYGKVFFSFFQEAIIKYAKKLPSLKPVAEDLIKDMELFLIEMKWL